MSGEQRFQKTFSRRKKASKPANNVNQKREKERGKEKRVKVEDQVKAEENANVEEALVVPPSSAESQEEGGDGDREVDRKPIANGGASSSSVSRSATKKGKSDGGGNVGRKQQPKQKRPKEEKPSQQGKQKKQKKEESKMKPKPKQEGKKQTGKDGKEELKKKKEKKKVKEEEGEEEEEASAGCRFPVSRVDRIIRSEGSDFRITNEAVFLINKASEKFLEIFCGDSYKCAAHDHKKYVSYNHLATAVSKEKRFDFLSDYVPEKVKAEKALAERTPPAEK